MRKFRRAIDTLSKTLAFVYYASKIVFIFIIQ